MLFETYWQGQAVGLLLAAGMAMGLWHQALAALARALGGRWWVRWPCDFLIALGVGILAGLTVYWVDPYGLRVWHLALMALGWAFYRLGLGYGFLWLGRRIRQRLRRP